MIAGVQRFGHRQAAALLALLAMLAAALQPIARQEALAAARGGDPATSDRWIGDGDGLQPAKIEGGAETRGENGAAPPPEPAALVNAALLRAAPNRAAAATPVRIQPSAAKAHQRPDPTGPPTA